MSAQRSDPRISLFRDNRDSLHDRIDRASICELLHQHWSHSIEHHLDIPTKAFKDYAVALVIRDTMNKGQVTATLPHLAGFMILPSHPRSEVTEMIHVLLRRMRFRAIFVIQVTAMYTWSDRLGQGVLDRSESAGISGLSIWFRN